MDIQCLCANIYAEIAKICVLLHLEKKTEVSARIGLSYKEFFFVDEDNYKILNMKYKQSNKIIGYHYTNSKAYKSMQTKGIDGYITFGFDDFTGLIPSRRFIRLGRGNGLPDKAHEGIIEGLLEPEPKSWLENPEFPMFWRYLMHDICREKEVLLLSFELNPKDEAYVVERAHVERELYRKSRGFGKPTEKTMKGAFRKYWESRVPAFDYAGGYSAPQFAIWTGIEFDRLKVEWTKSSDEVWKEVLDKGL